MLDILAIAAHRDDNELTCGGTIIKMVALGYKVGCLELTAGEMGTRGTAADREKESQDSARVLGLAHRSCLGIPDGRVEVNWENKMKVVRALRELRPELVILPYAETRHPDHKYCSILCREACFLAGLSKLEAEGDPHRPEKIIFASMYERVAPSFLVDVSCEHSRKLDAVCCYKSQFSCDPGGRPEPGGMFERLVERVKSLDRYWGSAIGTEYAEPFVVQHLMIVDDLVKMGLTGM
jgi:bacillithiol biosynthesis deacetylase BshB1